VVFSIFDFIRILLETAIVCFSISIERIKCELTHLLRINETILQT
jgi:hypothetical protein